MKIVSPKMEASQFEQMKGDLAFKSVGVFIGKFKDKINV